MLLGNENKANDHTHLFYLIQMQNSPNQFTENLQRQWGLGEFNAIQVYVVFGAERVKLHLQHRECYLQI